MSEINRVDPPKGASELVMLSAYLDYHRATLLQKVSGVSDTDLRRQPISEVARNATVKSPGITLLGLVKHLAYVERWWFQEVFSGVTLEYPWSEEEPDAEFRAEPHETTAAILNLYQTETAKSREVVQQALAEAGNETAAMELKAKKPGHEERNLRWVMIHMLEETARHNGHADLIREAIDGATGE